MNKTVFFLFIWFASSLYFAKPDNHYIVIRSTSAKKSFLKPLLISEEKIITATQQSDTILVSYIVKKRLRKLQIDSLMTFKYDRIVTDYKSFSGLINFINENRSFFISPAKERSFNNDSYSINIDGIVYVIDPRKEKKYFEKLRSVFINRKYDVKVIRALENYRSNF